MLKFLSITNLAIISRVSFDLYGGLNLLTGETGAGKSIIVDALVLLLGRRVGADMIRTGEGVARVEGVFELKGAGRQKILATLGGVGIELEPDEDLLIRRDIHAGGRSRIFVNDQGVTASTIKLMQPALVEILGQGEQYALASGQSHLDMLDRFAGCEELRAEVARAHAAWRGAADALEALARDESERERVSDFLRYQLGEIEKLGPRSGEDAVLTAERSLLANAERALEICSGGYAELYESDESVLTRLAAVGRRVQELAPIDKRVEGWLELIDSASISLSEVADNLRDFGNGYDFSPERLGEIENRLAELEKLKRKYGRGLDGLIALRAELSEQLDRYESLSGRVGELSRELSEAESAYASAARRLSRVRREAAPGLERRVQDELRHLALERARFSVSMRGDLRAGAEAPRSQAGVAASDAHEGVREDEAQPLWTAWGIDRVEFMLAANPGESPRPLGRVASGGELSRLMLALRTVCRGAAAEEDESGDLITLIFDEIDAGIGGKTAEAVGRRLKALAARQQVLCVTHQAQIARFADHHYAVSKNLEGGRTTTSVRELSTEERIGELARMIGGSEDVLTARETARWMIGTGETAAETGGAHRRAKRAQGEAPANRRTRRARE